MISTTHREHEEVRRFFAAAYFSKSLAWSFTDVLMAFFLHVGIGYSAIDTGALLFVMLSFGALSNILVGLLIDALKTKRRILLDMHLCGALLIVATAWAQFGLAFEHSGGFILAALMFRLAFALYDVPQTAMISLLPDGDAEATAYVRLRSSLAAIARLAVTVANLLLAGWPGPIVHFGAGVVLAAISIAIISTAWLLRRSATRPAASGPRPVPKSRRFALPIGTVRLLGSFALAVAAMPVISRLLIFAPSTAALPRLGAWLLVLFTLGSVAGPLLTTRIEKQHGWHRTWLGSIGLAVLSGDVLLFTIRGPVAIALGLAFLHGVGLGVMGTLQWQTASRLVRDHAARTGQRTDGFLFGLVIFTIQCAVAIGSLLFAPLLDDFAAGGTSSALIKSALVSMSGIAIAALLVNLRTVHAA
ncbi:MFS transporter [Sphingomonas sp. MMS24-J13]|uniref:MFS transporter n=1 Tax=Sphingomonas sp. MMS24-J13 TaxID=3238686 RepID=UPI00384B8672